MGTAEPGGGQGSAADTLHSILRAVEGGISTRVTDDSVRSGFGTFWVGERPLLHAPRCEQLGYASVGRAGSERASWRRRPTQHSSQLEPLPAESVPRRGGGCPRPGFLRCPPPGLTVNGHPVEPAGFAHLVAHHALKWGRVLGAGVCEEQGTGGQEPGPDRQTVGCSGAGLADLRADSTASVPGASGRRGRRSVS